MPSFFVSKGPKNGEKTWAFPRKTGVRAGLKNGDTIAKLDKIREEKRTKCIDSYY